MNSLDERWRERERARVAARKTAPTPKRKSFAKLAHELAHEVAKIKPMSIDSVTFNGDFMTFEERISEPRQKSKLEQVMEALNTVKLTIKDLGIVARMDPYWITKTQGQFGVTALVKPLPGTSASDAEIQLRGNSGASSSAREAVRSARKALIELVTHEIDEWLYQAGLGPNPHSWSDGRVPDDAAGQLSERFA